MAWRKSAYADTAEKPLKEHQTAVFPPDSRGHTGFSEKQPVKMGIVLEAAGLGNFFGGAGGCLQQVQGPLKADMIQIGHRRLVKILFENMDDLIFAVMKFPGQLVQGDGLPIVLP